MYKHNKPYKQGLLNRGLHKIYFECSGNKKGIPIVVLHGGPGSGINYWIKSLFNPEKFNLILFDQRGCGKSEPHACLKENTTQHLVDDINKLKEHLNIDKWHVFGGSWGSTLAICYANQHPKSILSITMYGIFLCREEELRDLYFKEGIASKIYPEYFDKYINILPKEEKDNPIKGYNNIFNSNNEELINKALKEWTSWEVKISKMQVTDQELEQSLKNLSFIKSHSLIENHYFINNGFIDSNKILRNIANKVSNTPINIVQGRYDMVCPIATAYELHKKINHSKLYIMPSAGHSVKEIQTSNKLIDILNNI